MTETTPRAAEALRAYARRIFEAAGLAPDKARAVGQYLVEADMMGHTTHGLALAPWYLAAIDEGVVPQDGTPEVISDRGPAVCWRGRRLPGAWLAEEAMLLACQRARDFGTATVVVGDSHHNGALAAYLPIATGQGLMASITSSSPSGAQVSLFGGLKGVMTPNPAAYGIPLPGVTLYSGIWKALSAEAKRRGTCGKDDVHGRILMMTCPSCGHHSITT